MLAWLWWLETRLKNANWQLLHHFLSIFSQHIHLDTLTLTPKGSL